MTAPSWLSSIQNTDPFADISDTGIGPLSGVWARHFERIRSNYYYFSGEFASETAGAQDDGTEPPPLYPLEINLAKWMCLITGAILLGQYDPSNKELVTVEFEPSKGKEVKSSVAASEALREAWLDMTDATPLSPMFQRGSVEQGWTGGFYLQIKKQLRGTPWFVYRTDEHMRPVWHPDNPNELIECTLEYKCETSEAALLLGAPMQHSPGGVTYRERWTKTEIIVSVNNQIVKREPNTLKDFDGQPGLIPFQYFPRDRTDGNFYGDDLVHGIVGLMLELNIRMRDIGDAVEYRSHPYIWARNLRTSTDDLNRRPSAVWDLGKSMGDSIPEVGAVDAGGVDPSAFEYLDRLLQMMRYIASITPVDVGEDEGSQRSGLTLEVRKMPAIQQAQRTRTFWHIALQRFIQKALSVYVQTPGNKTFEIPKIRHIRIVWPDLLPQDRMGVVQEIVSLASVQPIPRISLKQSIDLLKRVSSEEEIEEIMKDVEEARKQAEATMKLQADLAPKPAPGESLPGKGEGEGKPGDKEGPTPQREQQEKASKAKAKEAK